MKALRINLDALGMCASTLCMIHCLAFPVLLAILPMWTQGMNEADRIATAQLTKADSNHLAPTQSPGHGSGQTCYAPGGEENSVNAASCCATTTKITKYTK